MKNRKKIAFLTRYCIESAEPVVGNTYHVFYDGKITVDGNLYKSLLDDDSGESK